MVGCSVFAVRPVKRVRVHSKTKAHRERFAHEISTKHGLEVLACDDTREVYRGADILAACTDSVLPVIRGEWLEAGMHVISIGGRPDEGARARFGRRQFHAVAAVVYEAARARAGSRDPGGLVPAGHPGLRREA